VISPVTLLLDLGRITICAFSRLARLLRSVRFLGVQTALIDGDQPAASVSYSVPARKCNAILPILPTCIRRNRVMLWTALGRRADLHACLVAHVTLHRQKPFPSPLFRSRCFVPEILPVPFCFVLLFRLLFRPLCFVVSLDDDPCGQDVLAAVLTTSLPDAVIEI
jgi:hypothetical protein